MNDGAKIILGPVYAEAANAAGIAAARKGVNVLAFSNNLDRGRQRLRAGANL